MLLVATMSSAAPDPNETLEYRWRLLGLKGALARIFFPGSGDGLLRTQPNGTGNLETELVISSSQGRQGEFWLYGAEVDPLEHRTVRAWQRQHFRGKSKSKESEIDVAEALDLASSILFLRRELPPEAMVIKIWASGELRPVAVRPAGRGSVVLDGQRMTTRNYELRGAGRPFWSGELDIVLADDEAATPVEIIVARDGWKVRLRLERAEFS